MTDLEALDLVAHLANLALEEGTNAATLLVNAELVDRGLTVDLNERERDLVTMLVRSIELLAQALVIPLGLKLAPAEELQEFFDGYDRRSGLTGIHDVARRLLIDSQGTASDPDV